MLDRVSPADWLIGATTPAFLAGLMAARRLQQALLAASDANQELLRGERLPVQSEPVPERDDRPA
jgi:hypothetical protein